MKQDLSFKVHDNVKDNEPWLEFGISEKRYDYLVEQMHKTIDKHEMLHTIAAELSKIVETPAELSLLSMNLGMHAAQKALTGKVIAGRIAKLMSDCTNNIFDLLAIKASTNIDTKI